MKSKNVLELRPTQFAVGMLEVDEKIKSVREMGKKKRRNFIEEHVVPVIIGPDAEMYVVDHHHFLVVCYYLAIEKVRVKVVKDLSNSGLRYRKFWKWMNKSRNSYPFCQFGEGPRSELYLPKDIRGLADDPYRSIAWFVRKSGAFESSDKNFAEFKWANFFRKKGLLDEEGLKGFEKALVNAVSLAQSKEARRLPGYGKLNLEGKIEAKKKIRLKVKKIEKI